MFLREGAHVVHAHTEGVEYPPDIYVLQKPDNRDKVSPEFGVIEHLPRQDLYKVPKSVVVVVEDNLRPLPNFIPIGLQEEVFSKIALPV